MATQALVLKPVQRTRDTILKVDNASLLRDLIPCSTYHNQSSNDAHSGFQQSRVGCEADDDNS